MGICPLWGKQETQATITKQDKHNANDIQTDRPLTQNKLDQENKRIQKYNDGQSDNIRENTDNNINNSNSIKGPQMHKNFSKIQSTSISGNQYDKRQQSSILMQSSSIQPSIIIHKGSIQSFAEAEKCPQKYYTIIDKVIVIKKSQDCIKVSNPHTNSQLNCHHQSILPIFSVCQGLPLDSLKQFNNKYIIQKSDSPIKVILFLKCKGKQCQRQIKLIYAKSIINTQDIQCDKCGIKGNWILQKIKSNVPVWGDGRKIQNNQVLDPAPKNLRTFGCIMCMKYQQCQEMDCGCLVCKSCKKDNNITSCQICQALE